MPQKTINTRVQLKNDTEANWNKAGPKDGSLGFVPLRGELIIYSADDTHAFSRLKVGDGTTNVVALPFIDAGTVNGATAGKIGSGNNLVVTDNGTVKAGATIASEISTQTQSTKFLREDGTWAAPSYTTSIDGDTKVTQTGVTADQELSILLKNSENTTDETTTVKYGKTTDKFITVNPSTGRITAPGGLAGKADSAENADNATTAINLTSAPTITQEGSSGTALSAATFYTLTVGGQAVVFKTPSTIENSAYGNINTSGQIGQTTSWALTNGDALVVADSSNSWKLERTGIAFDASTETECLTRKGTWKAFNNYSLPIAKNDTLGGVKPWYSHNAASIGPTTGSNTAVITVNAIQTTAERYYAIESDSNGRLFVNVPWTNVNSSYLTSHNNLVTQNIKTDNKKYGIILSNYETSSSTTTEAAVNRDSKVYVNPSLNSVNAGQFVLHDKAATPIEKAYMVWNQTDLSIDFIFN